MATQTGSIDLRGVKQSYESVDVGGRNLALQSNLGWTSTSYNVMQGTLSEDWVAGETYTIQIKGTPSNGAYFGVWRDDGSVCAVNQIKTQNNNVWWATVTCPQPSSGATVFNLFSVYDVPSTATHSATIEWIKIEKGNKATDWTPAPEDVQEDIDMAQDTASTANSTASNALNDAASAAELAGTAQQNALEAKGNIEDLEAIIGASNWVTGHGIYNKSTDTTVNIAKEYYTVSATAVSNPTGSPHKGLYYELSNSTYILTSDDAVVSGKTYYTLSANLVDEPTGNPSTSGYYERNLNESIEDYLSTHIKMNSNGLFVTDGSASQVQVSSTGVSIWNGEKQLANYGATARIGAEDEFHIQIGGSDNEIGFYQGANNKVAYINGQALYVTNSLSFGEDSDNNAFIFYQRANGHFTLKLSKKVVS